MTIDNDKRPGKTFPIDAALLFLLLFLNLPSEWRLEFGREMEDLGAAGSPLAGFFEKSLVKVSLNTRKNTPNV